MKKTFVQTRDIRLILDNIRSVHNVGSIFRTAETIGISSIYCVGTTPGPIDRFGRPRKDLAKVALGAEKTIPSEQVSNTEVLSLIKKLKKDGFEIISLEQVTDSVDYKEIKVTSKTVIILGNEVEGVSSELLTASDVIAEIPLAGKKESLNVSVAAGILLFQLFS